MPCHTCNICMVSLQNEFDCELLTLNCFDNTFHIQYICIYLCVYSCVQLSNILFYTVCHTLYTNMALTCHHVDAQWHHYYQLQCLHLYHFLYIHNMICVSFNNKWQKKWTSYTYELLFFSDSAISFCRETAVPAEGNGDLQTLIRVLVARPRQCPTLLNLVAWQNWMVAYLSYTLWMKMLFRGWPVMVHDTHTRRRRGERFSRCWRAIHIGFYSVVVAVVVVVAWMKGPCANFILHF